MKLLMSVRRELVLLSRSLYFYVEIAVAAVFLIALLVVLPEELDVRVTEYLHFNAPQEQAQLYERALFDGVEGLVVEDVALKNRGKEINARLYTTELKYQYVVDDMDTLIELCRDTGHVGTVLNAPGSVPAVEVYLQGNETPRYREYTLLALSTDSIGTNEVQEDANRQVVRALEDNSRVLTVRQSVLPLMLTVNCVLMGILVTAAYIVEDKKTKVIKALRVLPARISAYLAAKMAVVILTALATCLIVAAPIMGGDANYLLLCLVVVCGGFFTVSIGALIASFFDDIGKAFGAVFMVLIILMIPGLTSLMPTINTVWLKVIPSYYITESIKESLLNRDAGYVALCCAGFFAGGLVLLPFSVRRYKSAGTGTVG